MQVARLKISNFRGIKSAELDFSGHALLIGSNNVGKSTICEALDLVLGADRLNRASPIDEFDFYNAKYLEDAPPDGGPRTPIELQIEAILIDPGEEVTNACGAHLEFWHREERRVLGEGEAGLALELISAPCLRLVTIGKYDPDEDEFEAHTYFCHPPDAQDGELTKLPRKIKRIFGFLYLRALRTGSRALSLERGTLLDIILRTQGVRTELWEKSIQRLKDLDIEADAQEIAPVLRKIEKRLGAYIAMNSPVNATKLHVSELTRDHLRKTMSFFLALSFDQKHVPFAHAGTGTLNTLVLALLSVLAELKPASVIFAMEEPEIAVPPPTQRRIAQYLLTKTTQAFVTSHSPFVIERFEPSNTLLLARVDGTVSGRKLSEASGLTDREFKQFARWGLCECMLGRAAVVLEGLTEFHAIPVAARRYEEHVAGTTPLDIAGATFFNADGESNMPKFGKFFKSLGIHAFALFDYKAKRTQPQRDDFNTSFVCAVEHQHTGFEDLVAAEMPPDRLWNFLWDLRESGEQGNLGVPANRPDDAAVRLLASNALKSSKGAGWAARLFENCAYAELPPTVMEFLAAVFICVALHDPYAPDPEPEPPEAAPLPAAQ